jgi:hypothetical protein
VTRLPADGTGTAHLAPDPAVASAGLDPERSGSAKAALMTAMWSVAVLPGRTRPFLRLWVRGDVGTPQPVGGLGYEPTID